MEGDLSLLLRHKAHLQKPSSAPILETEDPNYVIKKKVTVFIFDGEEMIELPKGKKKVLELLSKYKSDINTFVKNESLGVKKQEDLVRIIRYCNEAVDK